MNIHRDVITTFSLVVMWTSWQLYFVYIPFLGNSHHRCHQFPLILALCCCHAYFLWWTCHHNLIHLSAHLANYCAHLSIVLGVLKILLTIIVDLKDWSVIKGWMHCKYFFCLKFAYSLFYVIIVLVVNTETITFMVFQPTSDHVRTSWFPLLIMTSLWIFVLV